MLKLYNSLSKKKEFFKPISSNEVKMYSCGPTVYNYAHIGNLRAYVFSDLVSRTLRYFNYNVQNIMNITDVDDKTIKNASKDYSKEKEDPIIVLKKFTDEFKESFYEDISKLNIIKPTKFASAVDSINEIEILIKKLFKKKIAYVSHDGIYFDLTKYKKYGNLVNIDHSKQVYNKENRLVSDEYDKDNVQDFALWKFKKEETEPSWTITLGDKKYEGRPGWHIECSAMSMKYLGNHFDIHTGGVDNKFPHHENEIAQSECAHNTKYVNYWLHNEHLLVDGKKMAKSENNFYTLRDLIDKQYSPIALRELYLRSHYRQQLNFTLESLKAGETNIKKINDFYYELDKIKTMTPKNTMGKIVKKYLKEFEKSLNDDLNTPKAYSTVFEVMNEFNSLDRHSIADINETKLFLEKTDTILGLLEKKEIIPNNIIVIAKKRLIARRNNDWDKSDELRDEIVKLGYSIKDSKESKDGFIINKN